MRVTGQILENLLGPAERPFGVNHLVDHVGLLTKCLEGCRLGKRFHLAMELKVALLKRLSQMNQEPLAE